MIRKTDLERLAETRLNEAICLLEAGYADGAYYLAGYAIELVLKAVIAGSFQSNVIPDKRFVERIHSHDPARLVDLAGLEISRIDKVKRDAVFARNWEYVAGWSETVRYNFVDRDKAHSLIAALRQPNHGVFEWIKAHW